jgi:sigma-B regulation protein RsbU (phosphoserine phosphatase)
MRKIYERIVNLGVDENADVVLRNKLRVFNVAVLGIFIISAFYFVVALTREYYLSVFVTLFSTASSLLIAYSTYKRWYSFAFHYAMWYAFLFLTAFTFIFGAVTNSYYYFLFLPIACNIIFDNKRTITIYFIVSMVAMLVNVILMDHVKPYYAVESSERWLGYPNIPFVMLLSFLSVRMFKNENRKYALRVEEQRAAIEQKNKEVTDSINYARRIQSALLAPAALLNKNLPQHFVLYKPKDIVSGDFYYASETLRQEFWVCVGDCTGHGVPGAFMSLLNISILRELITEQKISEPHLLLNRQRERIISALNPDGAVESSKDGMDCVVAKFDFGKQLMSFSCANNPLWIVREGELHEFSPDKQPVGIHEGESKSFTLHNWNIQKGDCIYMFTDGFADQFGGPRGKKLKYSQMKEFVLNNAMHTPERQKQLLDELFMSWKGTLEQVDDVLVIGIEI